MSAKLTFNDIENAELAISKLNFDAGFLDAVSSGTVDPSGDALLGALYINTTTGDLFRKIIAGAAAINWLKISSVTTTVQQNRYRNVSQNSSVTATDATAPVIGDLVGYCGVGAWSTSGVLSVAKQQMASAGSQNAGLVAGGFTSAVTNVTELFNGSSWATSGVLSIAKNSAAGAGSQNAGLVAGGNTGTLTNATELFNGSSWATSGVLSVAKQLPAGAGSQNSAFVAGGFTNAATNVTELFNGSSWATSGVLSIAKYGAAGAGSQNAGLVAGGFTSAVTNVTELFNGSSWATSGVLSIAKYGAAGAGSQNAGLVAGGFTSAVTNVTELFNGSSWATSGVLSVAKQLSAGAGSQNAGLVAGGATSTATNATELHSQTTFRKVFAKDIPQAKNIGILSTTSSVMLQGTNLSVTYPANKFMILNRSLNASVTNYSNLNSMPFASILGTQPTMTYNLSSTTTLLAVLPGMIVIVTAGGANPVSAGNAGTFIISRIINPSSFEIQNVSGVAQNPGTGTVSIISTMLAVDNINPQDIVVGRTDAAGLLTVQKPLMVGSLIKRLK